MNPDSQAPESDLNPDAQSDRSSLALPNPQVCGEQTSGILPIENQKSKSKNPSGARRNGNIARLPKPVRDKINLMIQDGVTYASIIEQLGENGKGLGLSNLSRWKDGGYQDWLLEQSFIGQIRDRLESASDLTRDYDASQVNHAALQLGTLQIFDAFRILATEPNLPEGSPEIASQRQEDQNRRSPTALDKKLGGNSPAFARLMHALARASSETLQLQRYREACANARAAIQISAIPNASSTMTNAAPSSATWTKSWASPPSTPTNQTPPDDSPLITDHLRITHYALRIRFPSRKSKIENQKFQGPAPKSKIKNQKFLCSSPARPSSPAPSSPNAS